MKETIFSTLLGVSLAAVALEADTPSKKFIIPRIETTSTGYKLDGQLTDKVWEKSAFIENFVPIRFNDKAVSAAAIKNQTSVKIFYDVDAVYLGFTCRDTNIKQIITGLPAAQTVDVPIAGNDDCLELMIFLPGSDKIYYHLRIVPSGAKEDARNILLAPGKFQRDNTWNGDWTVRTSKDDGAWYAEVKIPLKMFADAEAGFLSATPAKGAGMMMNLGRVSSTTAETTAWVAGPNGFHSKFVNCEFGGMPYGDVLIEKEDVQRMNNGKNIFNFTLRNMAPRKASIRLVATLTEDEPDPEKRREQLQRRRWVKPVMTRTLLDKEYELEAGEKLPLSLEFDIRHGGEKILYFNTDWLRMKHNICRAYVVDNVYDIGEGFKKNTEKAALLKTDLQNAAEKKFKIKPEVEKEFLEVNALLGIAADAKENLENKAEAIRKAETTLKKIDFHISTYVRPSLWNLEKGKSSAAFAVGTASSGTKIFRDLPFSGTFSDSVQLSLAGNEYESVQFAIFYLKGKEGTIKVSCTDLQGEKGTVIKTDQIFFNPVGYVNVGDSGHHTHIGYWPDVLYTGATITPPEKGTIQPVMLTLKTAKDQIPGCYKGKVIFENGGEKHEIALNVRVYPFSLPDSKSLGMNIWFHGTRIQTFYGDFSPERFEQIMGVMGKYHIATGIRDNMFRSLLRVKKANGKYEFDFSRMTPYYDIALKNHANVLNLEYLDPEYFKTPQKILIGAGGKLENFMPDDPVAASNQLFQETIRYFKEKGYYQYALLQVSDEPWSPEKQEYIRKTVQRFRTVEKELPPTISAGAIRNRSNLNGYITIWCPQFPQFNPHDYKDMPVNESLYFYQCLYKPDFPMFMIDRPGIEPRISSLVCWKYQAKGFIYWASEQWIAGHPSAPENQKKLKNRWIHEEWGVPFQSAPGDACFIYPTKDGVVASLRAQYIRDGIEDYEYLAILKQYRDIVSKKGKMDSELRKKIEALLKIPDNIVKATNVWTCSDLELAEFRNEVAENIAKLKEIITKE